MAAEFKNYSYSKMVRRIIMMAAQRHPEIGEEVMVQSTINNSFYL